MLCRVAIAFEIFTPNTENCLQMHIRKVSDYQELYFLIVILSIFANSRAIAPPGYKECKLILLIE